MGTNPTKAEVDIKSMIKDAQSRLGIRVCVWYIWHDCWTNGDGHACVADSPRYHTFPEMAELARWNAASNFWTQGQGVVLRRDGLFLTGPNPLGIFGQEGSGHIAVRTQWALLPIPPGAYATTAERFNITASALEAL